MIAESDLAAYIDAVKIPAIRPAPHLAEAAQPAPDSDLDAARARARLKWTRRKLGH